MANGKLNRRASVEFIVDPNKEKKLLRVDLVVIILSVIFLAIGLGVGLLCFFLLQAKEQNNARAGLDTQGVTQTERIQKIITSTQRVVRSVQALFSISKTTVDYYDQYINYVSISQSFVPGIVALSYSPVVKSADVPTFLAGVRAWGGVAFSNYSMTSRDASNQVIPAPSLPVHIPVVYVAPTAPNLAAFGFDSAASPVRMAAIAKCNATGDISATGKTIVATAIGKKAPGTLLYAPVYDSAKNFIGTAGGVFQIDVLLLAAVSDQDLQKLVIVLFDSNANATDVENYFLYSSIRNGQVGWGNVSTMTTADHMRVVSNAAFTSRTSVQVGDRNWTVVYVPTEAYMNDFQQPDKWIALFTPIVICAWIVIVIVVVSVMKRLQYVSEIKSLSKQKVELLQESQSKLNELLNRISEAEQNVRVAMNEMVDIVLVVDEVGKILEVNEVFRKLLKYPERDIDCLDRIFPDVGTKVTHMTEFDMKCRTHLYEEIECHVTVTKMGRWEGRAYESYMITMIANDNGAPHQQVPGESTVPVTTPLEV
jgi:CHASE1-domain containing sensor protein